MSVFIDNFTDTDNTTLASHTGDSGVTWSIPSGFNLGSFLVINTNRAAKDTNGNTTLYYASPAPSANHIIYARFRYQTNSGMNFGVLFRGNTASDNFYNLRYNQGNSTWELRSTVNGNATGLGSWAETLTNGDERDIEIRAIGTSIEVFVAGVSRISVTNSDHSSGSVGMRAAGVTSPTAGMAVTSITVDDAGTPTAPSGLNLNAVSPTQVDLTWTDNSFNETSFRVERKTGAGGTYAEIGSNAADDVTYSDTTVSANTTYYYRVRARNASGDSSYLTEQSVTTPSASAPTAPSALSLNVISATQVNLTWTDNSNNETSFRIERKTGSGGTYAEIGSTATNVNTYSDTTAAAGTTYFYRVRARNGVGDSAYCAEQSATTPSGVPIAPSALTLLAVSSRQVNLAWTNNANNATSVRVERKTGAGGTYSEIASVAQNAVSYADKTTAASTTYFYRVRARNAAGDSAYLTEQSITTPNTVTLWTANIQHGAGTDDVANYTRQLDVLTPAADIIGVQERTTGDNGWNTGLTAAGFVQAVYLENDTSQGDGPAIWYKSSTVSVQATYTQKLSTGAIGWDGSTNVDKAAVGAKVTVGGRQFYVFNTHLAWSAGADSDGSLYSNIRVNQIKTLLTWIAGIVGSDTNYIILGDLNFAPDYPREQAFTAVASTDVITSNAHGFANGAPVTARNVGGALPGNLAPSTTYYIRDKTTNTFKLASTLGGAAIDLTSNGTGTNYVVGLQLDLFTASHTDLWREGIATGKATASWADLNADGAPDMTVSDNTVTHDTRRIDYFLRHTSAANLALRSIDMPDLRVQCSTALTGNPAYCPDTSPSQRTQNSNDFGVRPSDHNWVKLVMNLTGTNQPPSVNAGADQTVSLGSGVVPVNYNSPTDRTVRTVPALTGALDLTVGGRTQGYSFTDPIFGSVITRITHAGTLPGTNQSYSANWSGEQPLFNSNGTKFYVRTGGSTPIPFNLNTATGQISRMGNTGVADGGIHLNQVYGEPCWSRTNPNYLYAKDNSDETKIARMDFTNITGSSVATDVIKTVAVDISAIRQAVFGLSAAGQYSNDPNLSADDWLCLAFHGASQDLWGAVLLYNLANGQYKVLDTRVGSAPGTKCRWWDSTTGVWTNFTYDGGWMIHNVRIDKGTRQFLTITRTGTLPGVESEVEVWDSINNTLTNIPFTAPSYGGGHKVGAYGKIISQTGRGSNTTDGHDDNMQWNIRNAATPTTSTGLINPVLNDPSSVPQATYAGCVEDHTSWHNAQPNVLVPVFSATYRYACPVDVSHPWRTWDNELIAIRTDGAESKVWRFGHHHSLPWVRGANPGNYVFLNVSPDGRYGVFESVWEDTLGVDSGGLQRTDAFLIAFPASAGGLANAFLSGTASDADGDTVTTTWSQVSGPNTATIASASSLTTVVGNLIAGVYVFRLTASDGINPSVTDDVQVFVLGTAPVVNAGQDQTLAVGATSVVLNATASDPDGTAVSVLWSRVSGPNVPTIQSPTSLSTNVTGLVTGTYVFRCTATDATNEVGYDEVQIVIPVNQAPSVNAGTDQSLSSGTTSTTLSGTAIDPEGQALTKTWSRVSGPNTPTITTPNSLVTTVTGLVTGTYVFRLTVSDGTNTVQDDIQVVVSSSAIPVVNAGTDRNLVASTTSVTLVGTATDPDGTITGTVWSKVSGPACTIVTPTSLTTSVTGMTPGVYVFRLTATDNTALTNSDDILIRINSSPVINAGSDVTISAGSSQATLAGTATDADGDTLQYAWSLVTGASAPTIVSPNALSTTVTGLVAGTYIFRLTVNDNVNPAVTDDVQVTVAFGSAPRVTAGDKILPNTATKTTLKGSATNLSGGTVTKTWSQVSGPSTATINSPNSWTTTVDNLAVGTYVFRLTVTDGTFTVFDEVSVTKLPHNRVTE